MNLELTEKEYGMLLDMLYIAESVMNSYVIGQRPETESYRSLEQKILSCANDMGCKPFVDYDEKLETYFPSRKVEEGPAAVFIDEYDDYTFWEQLVSRLAERDFVKREGMERIRRMKPEQRITKLGRLEERYHSEFETHGLDRLILKEDEQ